MSKYKVGDCILLGDYYNPLSALRKGVVINAYKSGVSGVYPTYVVDLVDHDYAVNCMELDIVSYDRDSRIDKILGDV